MIIGIAERALAQHAIMNVADRAQFFAEAYRGLKPGGFFALMEHGLGPTGLSSCNPTASIFFNR